MMVSRGDIYLANLNPVKKNNEIGKIRPVVVYQNDELNHSYYPTTIIFPLSTDLVNEAEPLRMRISKRDNLEKDSDLIVTQIRAIDNRRLIKKIAKLKKEELIKLKQLFDEVVE
ncbi:MAG TPA: type II toxin-antitoxin system PemK/MazF family toxin [Arcobacter sp.]|nr:type II toxin-antitoxin system PemK/MazF family toxin [Arcobacter sp.]